MIYLVILSVLCVAGFGVFVGISIMQKNTLCIVTHALCLLLTVCAVICEVDILRENTLAVMNQAIAQGVEIVVPPMIQKEYERRYK